MMKKLSSIFFVKYLLIGICSLSFVNLNAQTCDENVLKALEQTRATTFENVNVGSEGYFYIRYPFPGTTYTFTDDKGGTYSLRYVVPKGGTEQVFLTIPVGKVHQKRTFSLKATNEGCTYQSGYLYTITPQITPALSLRIEPEWCNDSGAIYYQLIGKNVNPSDYKVYYKKSSETAYSFNADRLVDASLGVRTLSRGDYDLIAKHNSDASKNIEQKNITVVNNLENIDFTPTFVPTPCEGNGNIKVKVNSGKYPLYFTLYNKERNKIVRPKQTSNVFVGIPKGEYQVLVENFCAIGGGTQSFRSVVVDDFKFQITSLQNRFTLQDHTCDKLQFSAVRMDSQNVSKIWNANTVPYPFTIELTLISPTGRTYPFSYTINDKDEFTKFFEVNSSYIQLREIYQNIPIEYGTWTLGGRAIICGKATSFIPVTKELLKSIEYYGAGLSYYGNTCTGLQISTSHSNSLEVNWNKTVYYVLDSYPAHFNPNTEGFYKINSTHPSLAGKYVKRFTGISSSQTLIGGDQLRIGDVFRFKVVSEDCNKEVELAPVEVKNSSRKGTLNNSTMGSCKADKNGSKFASWFMYTGGLDIAEIKIVNFEGDATQLPTGFSLPYVVNDKDRISSSGQNWILRDLPIGKYTYVYTDVCGNVQTSTYQIKEETYSVTFEDGCIPKVKGISTGYARGWTSFQLQRFDETIGQWKAAEYTGSLLNNVGTTYATVTGEKQGKFRVVRMLYTRPELGSSAFDCAIVVAEKEFRGTLRKPKAIGFGCSGNKYHVAIIPQGGTAPFTYTLVSKKVPGQAEVRLNQHSDNENFFLNVDATDLNTYYVFKVTDACGQGDTVDGVISNFKAPEITADKTAYCNGQPAVLSLPDMGSKIKIQWYKNNDTTTPVGEGTTLAIASVSNGDQYSVKLVSSYDAAINSCLSLAIQPYTFSSTSASPAVTSVQGHDQQLCVNAYTTFDLNRLFTDNNPAHPQITKRIVDKNGVITVPENGSVNVFTSDFLRKNTFVYRLENACGEVLTQTEATLEVSKIFDFDKYVHTDVTICSASTYNDIKQLILQESKSELRANAPEFVWYNSLEDAQNEINPIIGTASIGTLPADSQKQLYLRLAKAYYCNSGVVTITVHQLNTNAPVAKSFTAACALNVEELKKLIDPTNFNNINIYQGGFALNNNFEFTTYTGITYTQKIGVCESQPATINLGVRSITQASAQTLAICTSYGNSYRAPVVTIDEIKAALRELYPNAIANGIKIYNYQNREYDRGTDEILLNNSYTTFSIEEAGKCPSAHYSVLFTEKEKTAAQTLNVSLCENATVADLKALISGSQVKIYVAGVLQTDNAPIDWSIAAAYYYYTTQETGKCPSYRTMVVINKATDNVTPIAERGIDLCGTTRPTVGQVKALLGNNARIYNKNGNRYYERVSDNEPISTSWLCYYTLQEAGKCMSEKAPLQVHFTPQKPDVKELQVFCGNNSLTVANLETKGGDIRWYREATGGIALSPNEPLVEGDYYAAQVDGTCESERKKVTVYPSLILKSLTTYPAVIEKGRNNSVTYTVVSVPRAIISYRINGGAIERKTINPDGRLAFSHTVTDTTTIEITELSYGSCSVTLHTTATIPAVGECGVPPAPQFAATDNAETTLNGVGVKRSFTGNALFSPAYGAHCQSSYVANYAWLKSGDNTKLTYTFTKPVKSATVWLLLMGNTPNGIDKAKISLNCGNAVVSKVYDCKKNAYFNGSVITSVNGVVNDVAIKVTAPNNGAFTELVVEDLAGSNGYGFFVEICPTSVVEDTILNIEQAPQPQQACEGGEATFTSKAALKSPYVGDITYQWQSSTDNGATFADIAGTKGTTSQGVATLTLSALTIAQHNNLYRVVYTYTNTAMLCNIAITKTSTTATLTLNNSIHITGQPASATYCKEAVTSPLKVVTTGTNLRYQWYQNTTNSIVGARLLAGETGDTYTPSTAQSGEEYYFVRIFNNACTTDSAFAKVTVQSATAIVNSPVGATYCQNATATPLSVTATGVGTLHYQWYQQQHNSNEGGTLLSGATQATYTPLTSVVTTTYYYAVVSSDCGIATSTAAKIEVQTPTAIVTQPANLKLCHLEPTANAMRVVATGDNLRYQWYDNGTNNSNVGGTAIAGEVYDAFVPPIHTIGVRYYYATVQGACGTVYTTTAARAEVQTPTVITLQPVSTIYCSGTPITLKVEAIGIGTIKYQWYYISNNTPRILSGKTNNTLVLSGWQSTNSYLVVVTSDCGVATSTIARVEVKSQPTIYRYSQRATYCKGAQATPLTVQVSGSEPFAYQWYTNTTNNQAGATAIAGATSNTYTPSTADAGTRYYFVEVKNDCKTVTSPIVDVKVQEIAPPTVTQTTHTLCSGTNQTLASLQPQGTNIVWYATATATTPLAKTTPLVAGTTYYVAQKNGTCESDRVAVAVTQGASGNETLVFSTPFSKTLKCVPSGQLRFQVQNAVAGQSYVVELTEVPSGYTGSRTFTITKDNKEGNVPFVWLTQNNIPKGTYKARLVKCGVSQEIGQTITELTSNFPIRDNFDAGPYVDINDCNYANLRNSQARAGGIDINAYFQNEAIAKQFFEYTAVSPQDMTDKGWTDASQIPDSYWREVYSLPAGITSSQPKVIYYDLAAFGRNYADLAIANKKPKFYFRIKGQPSCGVSAPIEFGDTRMLTMKMAYGGSCTAPTIKISLDRTVIVCKPITYEVKNEAGQVVASGSTNVANAIIDITNLNGNPINPNEKYSVTVKAAAPDTQSVTTIARSFNQAKAAYRPDGQYAEIKRCFGHPERTEMYIQGFLRDENGVLLSLKGYKVTLESAPAGYADEPNKLKVGESYTITRDASSYNLLSTLNVQNAAGFSSLPEGDYKIKIEDPCGQTYYVENGRRKKANLLTIEHPQYSEKPLTPEKEVACTGVKVYPFKGNTAQDWLKKNNQNQNLYVWLVKIPAGVNAADISTTPQQPGTYAGNTYQRAIYSRDNAATLNTYFTLPRNENSTGLYTFAYAEDEREIYNYIANSPTACVRTFTISVDDVLLNIDRSTYVGYKCEGSTGKIVVKAVNGINDANNYAYELYATKTGTVIETKTAAKGTTVTFTNLGTFSAGQNTRWLKLTDASCPTQLMWRELPIDILEKPANGKTYTFCAAATVAELKAKVATDTATVNVYKNGTLVTDNNEVLTTTDAYTVSRFNATCETDKVAVTVTISNTVSLTVPATLTVTCTTANIDATVNNWLGQATVTDTCGTATLTHNFATVKPADWCNTSVVTITFVGKDPLGNTITKTSTIKVLQIDAVDDTHTNVINGANGANNVIDVLQNDRVGGTQATTSNVQLTIVTPATGGTNVPVLDTTTGKISVPAGTKSGTYTIQYKICYTENSITVCDTATATVKVGSTPIVAKADTYTVTNGTSTTTTTGTVLDNDKLGTKTPTTTDVILTVVTTTTDVVGATKTPTLNSNGTITVPSGTKSGTYQIVYSICERLNPNNCATATATVKVGSTPIVAKGDTYTVTNGTSTTTTTGTVLDNDKLGTKTPTTTDVILTVVTTTTDVVGATKTPTLNNDGTITVPSGTKSGTYEIVYSICERLNPNNCATTTATVKVGSTPIVAKADTYTVTNGTNTITTTGTVLDNDELGTKTPTTTDVILTVVTTTTDVVGATKTPTLNNDGTVTVPSGTKSGTYEIVYSICERLNPDNCATATATVKVGSTPIVAKVDTYTVTNGTSTTTTTGMVLDNDKLGTKTPTTIDVILTVVTTTTDVVGATKTPTLNNDGTVTVPSGTKSGTYEIVYSICERLNSDNCATATATVKVGSTPIVAKPDTYTVTNGTNTTTTTGTVLDNDKLGTKTPTTADVILTVVTTTTDVVGVTKTPTLNNDGTVTVPSGTKSGTYQILYSICERLNPDNCATATATVKVGSTPIVAKPDTYTVTNGTNTTTTTGTVLDNDKLGTKTPTTTDVILTVVTTTTDVVGTTKTPTLNNDGTITVPSGTKSGTYEIVYSICERLNPDNCATTTATVKVGSTPIVAKADTYTITNGTSTTTTIGTVLDNDKLGTKTPTTTDVILTVVTTTTDVVGATKTPTLNNDGTITVPSGTKSGTYEIVYSICERLNPDNCATATATVKVFVPTVATPTTIEAVNDGVTTITSTAGGTTPSVLTNDKLNGVPNPSISSVTLTWNTATPTGFTLNPNGTITVAPNTPAGTHTISYTICAVASPTVCSTASIVVTVSGTTTSTTPVLPIAVDDRSTTAINTPVVVNVLGNDTPNGATTPNVVTNPANGTVVVNLDGSIEYRPNTNFEGTDTFVYEICNTDGCASATVTIDVVNKIVPYNGMSVDGDGKNDYFHIGGIERYPNNVVRIYNRWGVKVFEVEGYDNVTRVFRGISNGRVTIEQAEKLPQGTYYYVIEYYDSNNNKESLVGWLYLKK
ncbi:gliding motility-associated C-terminal domain-containing protein [Capnocytophaga sputigena]|uniref:T9SS type B sorting domain-containing protein n=1 Tax=Capnocytophaga sputigena TaxID=1019 RepID=UPI0031F58E23